MDASQAAQQNQYMKRCRSSWLHPTQTCKSTWIKAFFGERDMFALRAKNRLCLFFWKIPKFLGGSSDVMCLYRFCFFFNAVMIYSSWRNDNPIPFRSSVRYLLYMCILYLIYLYIYDICYTVSLMTKKANKNTRWWYAVWCSWNFGTLNFLVHESACGALVYSLEWRIFIPRECLILPSVECKKHTGRHLEAQQLDISPNKTLIQKNSRSLRTDMWNSSLRQFIRFQDFGSSNE